MSKLFFILGADDPEMQVIKRLLGALGLKWAHAVREGAPVHPGNAYKGDGTTRPIPTTARVAVVECHIEGVTPDVVFDHHRPGDPGFGFPPSQFWQGSSVGQVWEYLINGGGLEGEPMKLVLQAQEAGFRQWEAELAAAADHCLGHAYRGRCPGVDPVALRLWRAMTRAHHQGVRPADILDRVEDAFIQLRSLPETRIGGVNFRDARGETIPELPEASAQMGEPVIYSLTDSRSKREKVGVLNGIPEAVEAFMSAAPDMGLVDVYGDPQRGFAGGYLVVA